MSSKTRPLDTTSSTELESTKTRDRGLARVSSEQRGTRRRILNAGLLVLGLTVAMLLASSGDRGSAATTRAGADYFDQTGDSTGRLDIRSVQVTSSGDRLDMRVNLVQPTIQPTEHTGVSLDLNNDNNFDIDFYFDGTGGGQLRHVQPGTGFQVTPASLATFSNNSFGITFNIRLGALGSPSRFQFLAFTKERDEPTVWDWAPSSGWWQFQVQATPPPPSPPPPSPPPTAEFVARGSVISPNPPRAGDVVGVGTSFRYSGSGQPVRGGALSCSGKIGAQRIAGVPLRDSGLHACFFTLPRNSGGKMFTGRVTMTLGGVADFAQRSARIVDASAMRLTNLLTRNGTGPGDPVAGQNFSASVAVALVRPGSPPKAITSGNVNCPAKVGAKPLRTYFKGFVQGRATCSWDIPASAHGALFQGTIVVVAGELNATKTFTGRVR